MTDRVLALMRKPPREVFEQFLELFHRECLAAGKEQFILPYLISAFPGCTQRDMQELAHYLAERSWQPQQVQCFIPLPGTVAAAMYWAGIDPAGNAVPVARSDADRMRMHYAMTPAGPTSRRPDRGPRRV